MHSNFDSNKSENENFNKSSTGFTNKLITYWLFRICQIKSTIKKPNYGNSFNSLPYH